MKSGAAGTSAWRANLLVALGSVVLTLALLAVLEAGLRSSGIGDPDASRASRLKYQQIYLPIMAPGRRADGTAVLQPADNASSHQSVRRERCRAPCASSPSVPRPQQGSATAPT
jgi:hypothetical protein